MKIIGGFLVSIISTLAAIATVAQAAEVRVVGSTGLNAVIAELVSKFESSAGHSNCSPLCVGLTRGSGIECSVRA